MNFQTISTIREQKVSSSLNTIIVEDNPFNIEINKDYLKKCGANIIGIAKNGSEAV